MISVGSTERRGAMTEPASQPWVLERYQDWARRTVEVGGQTVRAVRAAAGSPPVLAVVTTGAVPSAGTVHTEDGELLTVTAGAIVPPGVHAFRPDGDPTEHPLVVGPAAVPDRVGRRVWGWQVQLYQLRSARSWGIGDYGDLAVLGRAAAGQGADLLLVNPMHAATPVLPIEPSPYFPSSRRFADQLGVCIELLPEYLAAEPPLKAKVEALRPPNGDRIDRDEVWRAKLAAFELLAPADVPPVPTDHPDLTGFAVFCALAEQHGADWRDWPAEVRAQAATNSADPARVGLHRWIQRRAAEQLDAAQRAARDAGMAVGIVHDLAVGVDPAGADAWLLRDELATGMSLGAPADPFNQLGQDWGAPPLRPDRLAETRYAPFRQVLRAALEHGGGIRVDHVMGLFRLWWVPAGGHASIGTYVRYDSAAMLAVLALEADRAGALVIGEDLGTFDPRARTVLAAAGVLGSAVLWFEREADEQTPLAPRRWRAGTVASVSTHDLPTAYGFLAGEQVRVRAEAGVLAVSVEEEETRVEAERAALVGLLRRETGLAPDAGPDETVLAMYQVLAATPSRVVLAAPADAVGDIRQPNLPGTTDEYPNWRLPLADRSGRLVTLEDFLTAPGTARLAAALSSGLAG
jgi:4-alpha-glucanotransferase